MDEERQIQVINQSLAGHQRSSLSEIHISYCRSQFSHAGHNHPTGDSQYDGFIHKEILQKIEIFSFFSKRQSFKTIINYFNFRIICVLEAPSPY